MPSARLKSRWLIYVCVIAAIITLYLVVDPVEVSWMPQCLFYKFTGWRCAGCGAQRLLHALLSGNIADAFHYNAFLFCVLPVIIFLLWLETVRKSRPNLYMRVYSPTVCYLTIGIIILWTIVRNLADI
ncbi:MAG: DUF2752 domain-containing protein [Prevotella sp.]|nr:DUF2752 domain-containing protein [Bacteroides sp.]MCM1365761.1 DUF2752 domain-containing protein [Prevotella sp.]MCM1436431.1 DUF2752 domain-containing protein [Prevotella sp.]